MKKIAAALGAVTPALLAQNYEKIDPNAPPPNDYVWKKGDEDFKWVLASFKLTRRFYQRAAEEGRAVLFHCNL